MKCDSLQAGPLHRCELTKAVLVYLNLKRRRRFSLQVCSGEKSLNLNEPSEAVPCRRNSRSDLDQIEGSLTAFEMVLTATPVPGSKRPLENFDYNLGCQAWHTINKIADVIIFQDVIIIFKS
jgi:hypothetical protein